MRMINRRTTLAGLGAITTAILLPVSAQASLRGFSFLFEIDGVRFAALATIQRGDDVLVTVRSLDNKLRAAALVRRPQRGSKEAMIEGDGRKVTISASGDEISVAGEGVKFLGGYEYPAPEGAEPQTQNFVSRLINALGGVIGATYGAIGDLVELITVGFILGFAMLFGSKFSMTFWDGKGSVSRDENGRLSIEYTPNSGGSGVMAPPPGTEIDPGVWY